MKNAIPFGSPAALIHYNSQRYYEPTTQDIAIVVCGGGDPFAEYAKAKEACARLGLKTTIIVGNDMIGHFPDHVDHAVTLHPDKLTGWQAQRRENKFEPISTYWSHRPYTNITRWTRDWSGSTGLMCVKIARELGHVHVVGCGIPMTVDGGHFVRKEPWRASHGFRRGWLAHLQELKPYLRTYSGWTGEIFGLPTDEWLDKVIVDEHRYDVPKPGLKA